MNRSFALAIMAIVGLFASLPRDAAAGTITYQQTFDALGTQATTSGQALADYTGWTYYESSDDLAAPSSFASVDTVGTLTLTKGTAARNIQALVTAQAITGAATFDVSTEPTTVSVDMTGMGVAGNFHAGLVFGNVELYFHPGYGGGYVRIGRVGGTSGADILNNFGDVGLTFAQGTMTHVSVTLANNTTNNSVYDASFSVGAYTNTVQLSKSDVGSFGSVGVLIDGDANAANGFFSSFGVATAAVPEPGTLALVATGLLSLLAYVWRKRK